jgi:hypothetical protein
MSAPIAARGTSPSLPKHLPATDGPRDGTDADFAGMLAEKRAARTPSGGGKEAIVADKAEGGGASPGATGGQRPVVDGAASAERFNERGFFAEQVADPGGVNADKAVSRPIVAALAVGANRAVSRAHSAVTIGPLVRTVSNALHEAHTASTAARVARPFVQSGSGNALPSPPIAPSDVCTRAEETVSASPRDARPRAGSAMLVAMHELELGLKLVIRLPQIDAGDRERLRREATALLARHGRVATEIDLQARTVEARPSRGNP